MLDHQDALPALADRVHQKYYGKYRGLVTEVEEGGLGRIRAEVHGVIAAGTAETPWAMPCVPFAGKDHGLLALPEEGDGVWIEFEAGDLSKPIWSGFWWADNEMPEPNHPLARLFATTGGHKLLLDDKEKEIKITHAEGAEIVITGSELKLSIGQSEIKMSDSEININNGMIKIGTSKVSLVNDAMAIGA